LADQLGRFAAGTPVSILDVGAGPLTTLGKRHLDRELDITAVDPWLRAMTASLPRRRSSRSSEPSGVAGETLVERFGEDAFDVVRR
jgi:hypothetical protein